MYLIFIILHVNIVHKVPAPPDEPPRQDAHTLPVLWDGGFDAEQLHSRSNLADAHAREAPRPGHQVYRYSKSFNKRHGFDICHLKFMSRCYYKEYPKYDVSLYSECAFSIMN